MKKIFFILLFFPMFSFADVSNISASSSPVSWPYVNLGQFDESGSACGGTATAAAFYQWDGGTDFSFDDIMDFTAGSKEYDFMWDGDPASNGYNLYVFYFTDIADVGDPSLRCDDNIVASHAGVFAQTFTFSRSPGGDPVYVSDPVEFIITASSETFMDGNFWYQLKYYPDTYCSTPVIRTDLPIDVVGTYALNPDVPNSSLSYEIQASDDPGTLDANGCFDGAHVYERSGTYTGFSDDFWDVVADPIVLTPTTTVTVVNNPILDWFLGFVIFFMCMVFPIWLFRRK